MAMKGMCVGCQARTYFDAVRQRSGFAGVVEIMRLGAAQRADADTQKTWCHALTHLLEDDISRISAANAGVINAVLAALQAHPADADVQMWGLRALALLVYDVRQNCDQACREGTVDAILAAMQTHRQHVGVQARACMALKSLALLPDAMIYDLPVVTSAIDAVVLALQAAQLDDTELASMACGALAELVWQDPARCARAGSGGAVDAVLAAMKKQGRDASMQGVGAYALHALSSHHAENREKAVASGALRVIVAALKTHVNDAEVAAKCCGTLSGLVIAGDAFGNGNCLKALEAGALDAVLATMKLHAGNADVAEMACLALGNACMDFSVQAQLVDAGGIDAVLAAVLAHESHAGVQERALKALSQLVVKNVGGRIEARDAGAIDACMASMRKHAAVTSVQDSACFFIDAMCDDEGSRLMLCCAGAIEEVVRFLQTPGVAADAAKKACITLVGLIRCMTSDEYCIKAAAAGAFEAVITVMRQHTAHAHLQNQACVLLLELVRLSMQNRIKARAVGADAAVRAAMQAHAENAEVVVHACAALKFMLSDTFPSTLQSIAKAQPESPPTPRCAKHSFEDAVAALRCSQSDAATLVQACTAIATTLAAAADGSAATTGSSSGALRAVDAIVTLLRERRRDARLQEAACRALAALTTQDRCGGKENAAAALRAGALLELPAMLRMHAADAAVQQHGQALLASLQRVQQSAAGAADAAMAALLAEEEALRLAATPSKRKGKKKSGGGGASSTAAAAALGGGSEGAGAGTDAEAQAIVDAASLDAAAADTVPLSTAADDDAKPSAQAARRRRRRAAMKAARSAAGDSGDGDADNTAPAPEDGRSNDDAAADPVADDDDAQPAAMVEQAAVAPLPAPLPAPVPSPAPPPPPAPAMKECCVCLEDVLADELRLISPCGHRCICAECGAALLARLPAARRVCPICSAPVGVVVRVFDV
jgi:hypothetical protein